LWYGPLRRAVGVPNVGRRMGAFGFQIHPDIEVNNVLEDLRIRNFTVELDQPEGAIVCAKGCHQRSVSWRPQNAERYAKRLLDWANSLDCRRRPRRVRKRNWRLGSHRELVREWRLESSCESCPDGGAPACGQSRPNCTQMQNTSWKGSSGLRMPLRSQMFRPPVTLSKGSSKSRPSSRRRRKVLQSTGS